ncbi:MAG TPA: hypothetical protein VGZ26_13140 [Pirellulales bacterium]|nr:hypothetical protein [Pirellulales bacterium]
MAAEFPIARPVLTYVNTWPIIAEIPRPRHPKKEIEQAVQYAESDMVTKKATGRSSARQDTDKATNKTAGVVGAISPNQQRILALLAKAKGGVTRKQMREETGILSGFSKLLGAPTKGRGFGVQQMRGQGLEPRGLVASKAVGNHIEYTITAAGRQVFEASDLSQGKTAHSFTLILAGVSEISDSLESALFKAGCHDALLGSRDGVVFLEFDRMAMTAREAILSAIRDVLRSGMPVQIRRVEPDDLVNASEIARRTGRSRESIRKLVSGDRGPGGFPQPISGLKNPSPTWRWSEVAAWFSNHHAVVHESASETARSIGGINALLELDRLGIKPWEVKAYEAVLRPTKRRRSQKKRLARN